MLKKLKMPKPKSMEMDDLDMSAEGGEEAAEEEMAAGGEEEAEEAEEEAAESSELEAVSDEDLLAEVKKRGLLSQLEGEMSKESAEDAYI